MQYYGCTLHKLYFINLPVQYSGHAPSKKKKFQSCSQSHI